MIQENLQAGLLSWTTRQGVFLADSGVRFWVFSSFDGRYAVQLDASALYPPFVAHRLGSDVIASGALLRPVTVNRGLAVDRSFRGRCGVLGMSGLRNFIKVIDDERRPLRLVLLPDVLTDYRRYTSFFPNWSLQLSVGSSRVPVFESASEPPRILALQAIVPPPGTDWSSPSAYLPDTTKR